MTVSLNKDEPAGAIYERMRPHNLHITKESERYQLQDQQLPQGFEMIFMNSSEQNEKLLIDAGSANSLSDLRSPLDMKFYENADRSPYM